MITLRIPLIVVTFLMFVGCASNPVAPESNAMPLWLTMLTRQLEAEPIASPPAAITRYEYKGQTVYFLPQRCCDIMSDLYNEGGSIVCHPDGGFTGSGDGKCPDFIAERRNEQVVWRDARGPGK
jgi:hypothetical protein